MSDGPDEGSTYTEIQFQAPTPPASTPKGGPSLLTSQFVLVACNRIVRGQSPTTAFRSLGINPNLSYWRKRAEDGDDPFWIWAIDCIDQALGVVVGNVEGRLHAKAMDGDVKALMAISKARSELFSDLRVKEGGGGGGVHITINQLLAAAGEDPGAHQKLQVSAFPTAGALEDREVIDAEEVPDTVSPGAMFKCRPAREEE